MSTVKVTEEFRATVHDAQTLWEDTARWVAWVEGLESIESVDGAWPAVGSSVHWRSGPAGRGRVTERVVAHEPLGGMTVEVSDDTLDGRQTIRFVPADEAVVNVEFELEYRIKRRSPFTWIVDPLFVRPAMRTSLRTTLDRFGAELTARQPAT